LVTFSALINKRVSTSAKGEAVVGGGGGCTSLSHPVRLKEKANENDQKGFILPLEFSLAWSLPNVINIIRFLVHL
jgi:hypothetical protein